MKVFIKTPVNFMGPEGAPKIPSSFFRGRHPPTQKRDNTSERVKQFLANKNKVKLPHDATTEPDMLEFINEKVEARKLD
jgi:hypothetical protein